MPITRETIEARLAVLQGDLAKVQKAYAEAQQTVQQAQADMNAIGGAIQDCQHWLTQLDPPTEATP